MKKIILLTMFTICLLIQSPRAHYPQEKFDWCPQGFGNDQTTFFKYQAAATLMLASLCSSFKIGDNSNIKCSTFFSEDQKNKFDSIYPPLKQFNKEKVIESISDLMKYGFDWFLYENGNLSKIYESTINDIENNILSLDKNGHIYTLSNNKNEKCSFIIVPKKIVKYIPMKSKTSLIDPYITACFEYFKAETIDLNILKKTVIDLTESSEAWATGKIIKYYVKKHEKIEEIQKMVDSILDTNQKRNELEKIIKHHIFDDHNNIIKNINDIEFELLFFRILQGYTERYDAKKATIEKILKMNLKRLFSNHKRAEQLMVSLIIENPMTDHNTTLEIIKQNEQPDPNDGLSIGLCRMYKKYFKRSDADINEIKNILNKTYHLATDENDDGLEYCFYEEILIAYVGKKDSELDFVQTKINDYFQGYKETKCRSYEDIIQKIFLKYIVHHGAEESKVKEYTEIIKEIENNEETIEKMNAIRSFRMKKSNKSRRPSITSSQPGNCSKRQRIA